MQFSSHIPSTLDELGTELPRIYDPTAVSRRSKADQQRRLARWAPRDFRKVLDPARRTAA